MRISQSDLLAIVQPLMAEYGMIYSKKGQIIARQAHPGERIETITSDGLETVNTAHAGDYIVQNKTEAGERYIISKAKFEQRYTFVEKLNQTDSIYKSIGQIRGLKLTKDIMHKMGIEGSTFHFTAPWGEQMVAKKDDIIAMPIGAKPEVYRIAWLEFLETYHV
jgi:hypothetical protein